MGCHRSPEEVSDYNEIKDASSESLMEEQEHLTRKKDNNGCVRASASLLLFSDQHATTSK